VVVLGLPAVTVYTITGLLLPWDQLSFWLAQGLLEGLLVGPVLGRVLADLAFGGLTLNRTTLVRAYVIRYVILGVGALVVAGALSRDGLRAREQ
jgi:quinol-cytochrome oxidoreductase complex cytochrome b subunit